MALATAFECSDCGDTVPVRRFYALRFSAYGREDTACARPNPEYRHQHCESQDSDQSDEHEYRGVHRFFLATNPYPIQMAFDFCCLGFRGSGEGPSGQAPTWYRLEVGA